MVALQHGRALSRRLPGYYRELVLGLSRSKYINRLVGYSLMQCI
jgi:hypothetical protein